MNKIEPILEVLQLYELARDETALLCNVPHDDLVGATNDFLFHHAPRFGITGSGDLTQGLRDGGVDSVWQYRASDISGQLGVQIKSSGDFDQGSSFRRSVMAQIAESRQYNLTHFLIGLAADLTNASHREKARGILADVARMTDNYVIALSPEKVAGLWKWRQGLNIAPIEQMRLAGYSWLTATYDSLGNLNQNSWGKGTGGDWSNLRCGTIHSGQSVTIRAIGHSPTNSQLEYRFSVQRSGQSFIVRKDWSPSDTWTWHLELADVGRHVTVMIEIRTVKEYYQFNGSDDYNYATYDVLPASAG
ncbi:hypothetical protein [Chromohalobacter canadensis]|uniref:hypothetical protein n=1 Tax=Chromohalobacter canadensis TaxID=141389 RepID=UPI00240FE04E|nr:hypothetical protein [Chromohalobacter canadensis]